MSGLNSTADENQSNRTQTAGEILREAMQPAPVVNEETQIEAEVETEDEVVEEQTSETIEASEETEQQEEEVGVDIETLTDLATAIEVENDFLYGIKVPMPDGQEAVSLSALKDAYVGRSEADSVAVTQLEEQRKAFEQEKEQYQQQLMQVQQMPEELLGAEAEVRAIASQYQTFDWAELEKLDPGRAALEKQNLATQYSQAEARVAQVKGNLQQQQQQQFEQMRIAQEQQLLLSISEWKDPTVRTAEAHEISTLLDEYGFKPQEIQATSDPRTLKMLRDYMQLKGTIANATTVKKKVMKTPKSLKPGAPKAEPTASRKLDAKIARAKATRDPRVKVDAISDLINSR